MRDNVIATYSHDDRQVRSMMRYAALFAFLSGWTCALLFLRAMD